jgi:hypothetical protein
VDKLNSDSLILDIFYSKGFFLRWFLYNLSIYDEQVDGINLKRAFEVKSIF